MTEGKTKTLSNVKVSNDRQTLVLTIVGIILSAMSVVTGVNENQPTWQLVTMIGLAALTVLLVISLWIPKIYFGLWLTMRRKALRGIYNVDKQTIKVDLIEIQPKKDFHHQPKNAYQDRQTIDLTYSMQWEKDYHSLNIYFSFLNKDGVKLQFESHGVEMSKKEKTLRLDFEFTNLKSVTDKISKNQKIPLIFGTAQMIFNLETKKLTKIIFNKEQDIITYGKIVE